MAVSAIENVLECMVCLEQFDSGSRCPKVLSCQHTLCLRCVPRLLEQSQIPNGIRCPICRKPHSVPKGKLDSLPTNLTMLAVLDGRAHANSGYHAGSSLPERLVVAKAQLRETQLDLERERDACLRGSGKVIRTATRAGDEVRSKFRELAQALWAREKQLLKDIESASEQKVRFVLEQTEKSLAKLRKYTSQLDAMVASGNDLSTDQGESFLREIRNTVNLDTTRDCNTPAACLKALNVCLDMDDSLLDQINSTGAIRFKSDGDAGTSLPDMTFKMKTAPVRTFGSLGSDVGQVRCPFALDMTSTDRLVVADFGNKRIQVLDSDGRGSRYFSKEPGFFTSSYTMDKSPFDVAVDRETGVVYSAMGKGFAVTAIDANGVSRELTGMEDVVRVTAGGHSGLLYGIRPSAIGTSSAVAIAIFDLRNDHLLREVRLPVDAVSAEAATSTRQNFIRGLSVCGDHLVFTLHDQIYATNLTLSTHRRLSLTPWRRRASAATGGDQQVDGQKGLEGVCVRHGHVFVADRQDQCVYVLTLEGALVQCLQDGAMESPWGVTVARDATVYVSDGLNHKIYAF